MIMVKRTVGRPIKDPKIPLKIKELSDKGLKNAEIARVLKISRSLVGYYLKRAKLSTTVVKDILAL